MASLLHKAQSMMWAMLGAVCAASSPLAPSAATQAWIDGLIIGHNLCPWARRASVRIVCTPDADALLRAVPAEADALRAEMTPFATTLLVLPERGLDAFTFGRIFCESESAVSEHSSWLKLLAFHPERLDTGPGCTTNPMDAAHFSTRSPLPTIQLLREAELSHARAEWESMQPVTARIRYPGAFGLLVRNKEKLRGMGRVKLQELMDSYLCSKISHGAEEEL